MPTTLKVDCTLQCTPLATQAQRDATTSRKLFNYMTCKRLPLIL